MKGCVTMSDQKSFLLYKDNYCAIRLLDQRQKGDLLDAIYAAALESEVPELDEKTEIVFSFIANTMARDKEKYAQTCLARSKAGRKGAEVRQQKAAKEAEIDSEIEPVIETVIERKPETPIERRPEPDIVKKRRPEFVMETGREIATSGKSFAEIEEERQMHFRRATAEDLKKLNVIELGEDRVWKPNLSQWQVKEILANPSSAAQFTFTRQEAARLYPELARNIGASPTSKR